MANYRTLVCDLMKFLPVEPKRARSPDSSGGESKSHEPRRSKRKRKASQLTKNPNGTPVIVQWKDPWPEGKIKPRTVAQAKNMDILKEIFQALQQGPQKWINMTTPQLTSTYIFDTQPYSSDIAVSTHLVEISKKYIDVKIDYETPDELAEGLLFVTSVDDQDELCRFKVSDAHGEEYVVLDTGEIKTFDRGMIYKWPDYPSLEDQPYISVELEDGTWRPAKVEIIGMRVDKNATVADLYDSDGDLKPENGMGVMVGGGLKINPILRHFVIYKYGDHGDEEKGVVDLWRQRVRFGHVEVEDIYGFTISSSDSSSEDESSDDDVDLSEEGGYRIESYEKGQIVAYDFSLYTIDKVLDEMDHEVRDSLPCSWIPGEDSSEIVGSAIDSGPEAKQNDDDINQESSSTIYELKHQDGTHCQVYEEHLEGWYYWFRGDKAKVLKLGYSFHAEGKKSKVMAPDGEGEITWNMSDEIMPGEDVYYQYKVWSMMGINGDYATIRREIQEETIPLEDLESWGVYNGNVCLVESVFIEVTPNRKSVKKSSIKLDSENVYEQCDINQVLQEHGEMVKDKVYKENDEVDVVFGKQHVNRHEDTSDRDESKRTIRYKRTIRHGIVRDVHTDAKDGDTYDIEIGGTIFANISVQSIIDADGDKDAEDIAPVDITVQDDEDDEDDSILSEDEKDEFETFAVIIIGEQIQDWLSGNEYRLYTVVGDEEKSKADEQTQAGEASDDEASSEYLTQAGEASDDEASSEYLRILSRAEELQFKGVPQSLLERVDELIDPSNEVASEEEREEEEEEAEGVELEGLDEEESIADTDSDRDASEKQSFHSLQIDWYYILDGGRHVSATECSRIQTDDQDGDVYFGDNDLVCFETASDDRVFRVVDIDASTLTVDLEVVIVE